MTLYLVDDHKLALEVINKFDQGMARYNQQPQPGAGEYLRNLVQNYIEWNGGDGTIEALDTVADVLHSQYQKDAELLVRQAIAILLTNKK